MQRARETNSTRDDSDDASFSSSESESNSSISSYSSASLERGYAAAASANNFLPRNDITVRRRAAPVSGNQSGSDFDSDLEDGFRRRSTHNTSVPNDTAGAPGSRHNTRRKNQHHHHHRSSKRRKDKATRKATCASQTIRLLRKNHSTILRHFPSFFLAGCFLFWLLVQTSNVYDSVSISTHRETGSVGQRNARLAAQQRTNGDNNNNNPPPPPPPSRGAFSIVQDAVHGLMDIVGLPAKMLHKASNRGEALPPGCVRSPWQVLNLQNCNDMHETDLFAVFTDPKQKGYVGAGYWRHVWLVDPRDEFHTNGGGGAVLKMMKEEHKVEQRNFERHRRDALAMERLAASKHIVDIYSYCGNSVLTEYVGSDMHQVLYHSEGAPQRSDREMLQLALDVVQGVSDLHQVPGGPIVHADIADKQFLVDDQGRVKLNDFNRCRFMGHKKTTKEKCTFRIPSAPGRHRSPEEYEDQELTEQLDTYSTANVLYGILTGKEPWEDLPSSMVKNYATRGLKPPIDDDLRVPGTPKALLATLIDQAYEHDFETRITAPQLVEALKKALDEL